MNKDFLTHVRNKDFVALGKQLHSALTHKVLENLANRKVQIAHSMGVKLGEETDDEGSAEDGDAGTGVNEEDEDLKDIPESKK